MKVYFSHTGIENWKPSIEIDGVSVLKELLSKLNDMIEYQKILNIVINDGSISSSTRIFLNVEVIEDNANRNLIKFYEKYNTVECKNLNNDINGVENVLIAVFDASMIATLLDNAMKITTNVFKYKDENGVDSKKEFKPMIQKINFNTHTEVQTLYEFIDGDTSLSELEYKIEDKPFIKYKDGKLDKKASKVLPSDLIEAIRSIWGLESGTGRLRLFQEDALFFIMEQLLENSQNRKSHLLLSMPTGGGKTEAFMIPLIASIYQNKMKNQLDRIKSIVIYPTNALANDQAMRFVEMIYFINKQLAVQGVSIDKLITIGILSGDTPSQSADLKKESLIQICPECGKSNWIRKDNYLVCNDPECGTSLSFCRLTKESILQNPPDILITNPDEINVCLHNPKMAAIFYSKIDSIVFDEVHVYQGIFGCHVAHLLRRLEEIIEYKPLYIGMSATIKNAQELAALLFNDQKDYIKYINDNYGEYTDRNKPVKQRLHIMLKPALLTKKDPDVKDRYVRTMSVAGAVGLYIGHLMTDSHFRKSIIFTNYRSEADDLASYTKQRERLDIELYFKSIMSKLNRNESLTNEEVEICQYMYKWFDSIINAISSAAPSIKIGWNRGGLEKETRIRSIHSFSRNNILSQDSEKYPIDLMIATKSLEVGIDIGDVTTVINASAPFTANEYVQRIGRGGRKKDSLAITVINPENAIDAFFEQHFKEYVKANADIFEDAPIILNNDIIIMKHINARLIDFTVKSLNIYSDIKWNIKCQDFIDKLKFSENGNIVSVGIGKTSEDVNKYVNCLFDSIFNKIIDGNRNIDNFLAFLKNETQILNTKLSDITEKYIKETYYNIINNLNDKLQDGAKGKWELGEILIGPGGKWMDYTPNLRGNGANVSLFIGNSEKATDIVSRQTAFNQMPPATDAKQVITIHSGISTFKIDGIHKGTDGNTEKRIRSILRKSDTIKKYFYSKIENFPKIDDEDEFVDTFKVTVPNALQVSYYPSRFYCPICEKGLVSGSDFSDVRFETDGVYCHYCNGKVDQLHNVYFCPECSSVYDPPISKICINPDCPDYKRFYYDYRNNGFRIDNKMLEHFKFRLTKDLEWECQTCKSKVNYSSIRKMIISNSKKINFVENVVKRWQKDESLTGVAIKYKLSPELFSAERNRKATYKCQNNFEHKNIKTIGVPRVRTISYSYVGNKTIEEANLCTDVSNPVIKIEFKKGFILQLTTQFMRRYITGGYGSQTYRLIPDDIFKKEDGFNSLGNYYESHLAWIIFSKKIDTFLNDIHYTCDGNCRECLKFEKLDLGDSMKPNLALENYNFDAITGKPKKPDYRGKYCSKAKENCCSELDCNNCKDLNKQEFLRYLIIHTIKHAVLWAMPKYAGVNISDIKGEIYPNDRENGMDLVLIDNNEGGSGAIVLVQRHWNKIWSFAQEIIKLTSDNKANILLNHNCSRNNADLCPFITEEYLKYLDE